MVKRLIYFATLQEASASLKHLGAIALSENCYSYPQGIVLVGGMGIYASMYTVSAHLNAVDELWNLGVAGCLHSHYVLGECVPIASVQVPAFYPSGLEERSQTMHKTLLPTIAIQDHGARLVTTDYPIHQASLRDQLAQQADLIDMEGYGIAYLAKRAGKRCVLWKVVSDFASAGGPDLIQQQLAKASERLAERIS